MPAMKRRAGGKGGARRTGQGSSGISIPRKWNIVTNQKRQYHTSSSTKLNNDFAEILQTPEVDVSLEPRSNCRPRTSASAADSTITRTLRSIKRSIGFGGTDDGWTLPNSQDNSDVTKSVDAIVSDGERGTDEPLLPAKPKRKKNATLAAGHHEFSNIAQTLKPSQHLGMALGLQPDIPLQNIFNTLGRPLSPDVYNPRGTLAYNSRNRRQSLSRNAFSLTQDRQVGKRRSSTLQDDKSRVKLLTALNNWRKRYSVEKYEAPAEYNIYKHMRLMPNDRRKPLTYKSDTPHDYDQAPTFSGIISKFYHAMLEKDWLTIIVVLSVSYVSLILIFAIFYYIFEFCHIAYSKHRHMDSDHSRIVKPCLVGVLDANGEVDFLRVFLLSLESQTTIGYGARHPIDDCTYPAILQTTQFLVNTVLMGFMLMITSIRMTRSNTACDKLIRYSKHAVIGEMPDPKTNKKMRVLVVRIANNQHTGNTPLFKDDDECNLVGVSVSAKVIVTRVSVICDADKTGYGWYSENEDEHETELIPLQEFEIRFENSMSLFGTAPIDYYHLINADSPFYELSRDALADKDICLEFIVLTTATIASTGTTYLTKQSYIQQDIKWGYRFVNCIEKQPRMIPQPKKPNLRNIYFSTNPELRSKLRARRIHKLPKGVRRHCRLNSQGSSADPTPEEVVEEYVVDVDKFDSIVPIPGMGLKSSQEMDQEERFISRQCSFISIAADYDSMMERSILSDTLKLPSIGEAQSSPKSEKVPRRPSFLKKFSLSQSEERLSAPIRSEGSVKRKGRFVVGDVDM